jgi:hypothetical protein
MAKIYGVIMVVGLLLAGADCEAVKDQFFVNTIGFLFFTVGALGVTWNEKSNS